MKGRGEGVAATPVMISASVPTYAVLGSGSLELRLTATEQEPGVATESAHQAVGSKR